MTGNSLLLPTAWHLTNSLGGHSISRVFIPNLTGKDALSSKMLKFSLQVTFWGLCVNQHTNSRSNSGETPVIPRRPLQRKHLEELEPCQSYHSVDVIILRTFLTLHGSLIRHVSRGTSLSLNQSLTTTLFCVSVNLSSQHCEKHRVLQKKALAWPFSFSVFSEGSSLPVPITPSFLFWSNILGYQCA